MDRNDILAKSRAEYKGSDEYERAVQEQAGRLAMQVGLLACCFTAVVEVLLTGHVSFASWTIYFSALSANFWVKYRRLRQQHELLVALLYSALCLFFSMLFIMDLFVRRNG